MTGPAPPQPPPRPGHCAGAWLLAFAVLPAVLGNLLAWSRLAEITASQKPLAIPMLVAAGAALPLLAVALKRLRRARPPAGPLLRWSFCAGVLLWFGYAALGGNYRRGFAGCLAACWSAAVAFLAIALPDGRRARPHRLAVLVVGVSLALLLGELLLRTVAAVWPGPLFVRGSASSAQRLRAHAFAPGEPHFGFPCNDRGFYDAPFRPPLERAQPAVAVIGDSFSASFVPHEFHYTTVAERTLGDVEVWNVGWAGLGPEEYRLLLQTEVLPLRPDAVVVSLFLGNDLAETRPSRASDRLLADWLDRGNVLLLEVPRRLVLLSAGGAAGAATGRWTRDLAGVQAYLRDPLREPGTFGDAEFLRIETERALVAGAIDEQRWDALCDELRRLRGDCGALPFGLVLIPDEAMVEDGLWQRVQAAASVPLERHALRARLLAWCKEAGVPCLDLWPALTAVPPLADGDRHLYLRRDTHWNVRGNEVAGQAMAPFVRDLLARR